MKRFRSALLVFLLCCLLSVSAMAASRATGWDTSAAVANDGSVTVQISLELHLEELPGQLYFPLPSGAEQVTLGGVSAEIIHVQGKIAVSLPVSYVGDHRFLIGYVLPDAVVRSGENACISLPLLSGFAYPIDSMTFTVTLPGETTAQPSYTSGYYQEDIANIIAGTVTGNVLTASVTQQLKDHETLTMTMTVPLDEIPFALKADPWIDGWDGTVLILAALATGYYLLTLFPRVYRRSRCCNPPEGISAGEVGTCLTGAGADLTMMVLTWAQLGYLRIRLVGRNKVVLYKQMEMGNERSAYEGHVFRELFIRRTMVDGTGLHYAKLCRKVSRQSPLMGQLLRSRSGNSWIFRGIACAAGTFSGVKLGLALSQTTAVQILLAIALCLVCGVFSYCIQSGGKCIPLRDKTSLAVAVICSVLWIALGVVTGQTAIAVPNVLFQLLCGLGVAYGGQRSELGKRCIAQLNGLRHHMLRTNAFELQARLQANPSYFFELAPYALTMGVDKRFARRFGKTPLQDPGFMQTDGRPPVTAAQWASLLRHTADLLNARQKRLPYERLTGR